MAYIYTITNKLNNKIYVGATTRHPYVRFKEHCRDAKRFPTRLLYKDINEYGRHNFQVDILEQCADDVMHKREMFWIAHLQSFRAGYNATLGGAGTASANYDLIIALWQQGKNNREIHEITSYDADTIQHALKMHNISAEARQIRGHEIKQRQVAKIDKDTNEVIGIYASIQTAYAELGKPHSGRIAAACIGKRVTAYGYKWAYADENT